jgi:peptide/nickel transport system substrate-binding protein
MNGRHVVSRRWLCLVAMLLLFTVPGQVAGAEKVFSYALEGQPESLDFAKADSLRAERVAWLLCDTLVYVSRDGQALEPGLAVSWTMSPDEREVVMRLRPGASFHDGTPVNAVAVKASIERQFRPSHELYTREPGNTKERMLSELIEDIRVVDEGTLALKLRYPGLHYLSEVDIGSPTALARLGKDFGRKPVCSGPFKFESWSSDRITLTANEKYWAGRPKIDRVIFHIVSKSEMLLDKLLNGELDFAPVITDPKILEPLREDPAVKLVAVPGLNIFYLGMYTDRPPFANPTLRKAVVHAIDSSRLAQILGRGTTETAKGPLPPAMKGYDPEATQAAYDPQAARELLTKAGFGARTVRLLFNNSIPFISEQAGAIRSDLSHVGVTVELLGKRSFGEVVAAVRAREGDMFLYNWFVRAPYPERILMPLFHSRAVGTSNLTHYQNPNVDKTLDEAMQLPEGAEQRRLYSKIQRTIINDAPMVFLFHWTRMAAHRDRVKGLALKLDSAPADKLVQVDLGP